MIRRYIHQERATCAYSLRGTGNQGTKPHKIDRKEDRDRKEIPERVPLGKHTVCLVQHDSLYLTHTVHAKKALDEARSTVNELLRCRVQ